MGATSLWRDGNYMRFRSARTVSLLGSQIVAIAYPLLVLRLGGSVLEAGLAGTCWLVARAVCRMPAGQLADRYDRRRLMIGADLLRVANAGTVPLAMALGHPAYLQLIIVTLVEGAATSVFEPASAALIRDVVPTADLTRALSQAQGMAAAMGLIGPPLGGLCFTLNPALPFIADAASYALSAALLLTVRTRPDRLGDPAAPGQPAHARATSAGPGPQDRRATAGLRWIWARPVVRWVLVFAAVLNVVGNAAQMAVVIILHEQGTAPGLIGIVLACIGAGATAGALLSRQIVERLDPPRLCVVIGAIWTGGLVAFACAPTPWVFGAALALLFFLAPAAGVSLSTITLSNAPHGMLGRIVTAEQLATNTLVTAAPLLAGVMLQSLGVSWTWLLLAAACVPVTVLVGSPLLSRHRAAAPAAPATPAAAPLSRK